MRQEQSWAEIRIGQDHTLLKLLSIAFGVLILGLLAQIKIPLAFTPVPITGQTFGVSLIALIYGRKLAFLTTASYLLIGGLGAPVFANLQSGLALGPSLGYLMGMLASSYLIGLLADKGYAKTWKTCFLSCLVGSFMVFSFGIIALSFFVPFNKLLLLGLLPFLPGDIIKNALATSIAQCFYHGK